ncbi:hypothetical protein KI387_036943, partial [Taxus chinensis]
LVAVPQWLAIEATLRNNLETNEEDLGIDESFYDEDFIDLTGDSNIGYLDYKSDKGYYESFEYSDGHTFLVFTRSHTHQNVESSTSSQRREREDLRLNVTILKRGSILPASLDPKYKYANSFNSQQRANAHPAEESKDFDIIDHIKKTKVQMSEAEYLRAFPDHLNRLV